MLIFLPAVFAEFDAGDFITDFNNQSEDFPDFYKTLFKKERINFYVDGELVYGIRTEEGKIIEYKEEGISNPTLKLFLNSSMLNETADEKIKLSDALSKGMITYEAVGIGSKAKWGFLDLLKRIFLWFVRLIEREAEQIPEGPDVTDENHEPSEDYTTDDQGPDNSLDYPEDNDVDEHQDRPVVPTRPVNLSLLPPRPSNFYNNDGSVASHPVNRTIIAAFRRDITAILDRGFNPVIDLSDEPVEPMEDYPLLCEQISYRLEQTGERMEERDNELEEKIANHLYALRETSYYGGCEMTEGVEPGKSCNAYCNSINKACFYGYRYVMDDDMDEWEEFYSCQMTNMEGYGAGFLRCVCC